MNFLKFAAFFLLLLVPCRGQFSKDPPAPVKGVFYVSVDDACTIFVNGEQKFEADIGGSESPEMALKVGDRVVVKLRNDGGARHLMLVFASSDRKTVVSFKHTDFRCVVGADVEDFTPDQFRSWKMAKEEKGKKSNLPVKGYSEKVWGEIDRCSIAAIITTQMISQRSQ